MYLYGFRYRFLFCSRYTYVDEEKSSLGELQGLCWYSAAEKQHKQYCWVFNTNDILVCFHPVE